MKPPGNGEPQCSFQVARSIAEREGRQRVGEKGGALRRREAGGPEPWPRDEPIPRPPASRNPGLATPLPVKHPVRRDCRLVALFAHFPVGRVVKNPPYAIRRGGNRSWGAPDAVWRGENCSWGAPGANVRGQNCELGAQDGIRRSGRSKSDGPDGDGGSRKGGLGTRWTIPRADRDVRSISPGLATRELPAAETKPNGGWANGGWKPPLPARNCLANGRRETSCGAPAMHLLFSASEVFSEPSTEWMFALAGGALGSVRGLAEERSWGR